jgi:hypothetical protein
MVTFPNANNHQIGEAEFLAVWIEYVGERFGDSDWTSFAVPRRGGPGRYREVRPSLDRLCRLVVPAQYRDAFQATDEFMSANARLLRSVSDVQDPECFSNAVEGVKLTDSALRAWSGQSDDQKWKLRLAAWEHYIDPDLDEPGPTGAAGYVDGYSLVEHKHRFSAWAASRAASVNGCRFEVEQGKAILERAGMREFLEAPERLPTRLEIDATHRGWRETVVATATQVGLQFSHGVAAKLINMYLKAGLVCGGHHDNPRVKVLHPPVDRLLLTALTRATEGQLRQELSALGPWSTWDSTEYERAIDCIRRAVGMGPEDSDPPLWSVERFWRGYQ